MGVRAAVAGIAPSAGLTYRPHHQVMSLFSIMGNGLSARRQRIVTQSSMWVCAIDEIDDGLIVHL